ncbi:hypothetical protein [Herbiconiux sp.]|uniref:hypothetical protein n=1 Tax=Herbiconiux sp. TaxID=1871186 RepID=UPI0025C4C5AB|nr:hypothetical protein [Herbiconiux sp.]
MSFARWYAGTIPGNRRVAPWLDCVAAQYEVAASDPDGAVCVFDLFYRVNSGAPRTAGGLLDSGKARPGDIWNRYIAEALTNFVLPR